MKTLKLKNGASALVIVAHPDDETIWMGGTMLAFPNVKWTILSLCRSDDPDRVPKFKKVCRLYGARAIISDLEDEGVMNAKESLPETRMRVETALKKIGKNRFTYLLTHGYNGEYGHPRHIGAHRAVNQMLRAKTLSAKQIFYFDYQRRERKNHPIICVPNKRGDIANELSGNIFKKKKNIIEKVYGFSQDSFEYQSCSNIETFRKIKKYYEVSSPLCLSSATGRIINAGRCALSRDERKRRGSATLPSSKRISERMDL